MSNSVDKISKWKNTAIVCWAIVGVFGVLWLFWLVLRQVNVVLPLVIYTMVLVYLLRPAVEKLQERGFPRTLAVVVTYLVMAAFLALLFWYLIPVITKQFIAFAQDVPTRFYPKLQKFGHNLLEAYQARLGGTFLDINKFIASFSSKGKELGLGMVSRLPTATFSFVGGILNLILAPILAFYMLKDLPTIKETITKLIPRDYRDEFLTIAQKTNIVLSGFLKGQLMVSAIVGLLVGTWLLILGVDFPFVLGAISGVLNIIPYLGPILGGSLAALVASFNPSGAVLKVILVAAGMLAIQQLDGAVISPQVMRRQVNLHPVLIVFALLIGGSLFGVVGMVLAIPMLAVAKVLLYHFVDKKDIF